ncbi:mechanosensitive ion channel family protein [Patescibacteria group bacterium]
MLTKKLFIFSLFLVITLLLAISNAYYKEEDFEKIVQTAIAISSTYFLFKIILEAILSRKLKNARSRYSFRKTVHILFLLISFIVILRIWIIDPQALMVAYGLVAAGVAISLQDLFKNFAGGVMIFFVNPYQVGHRIELNGKCGDVIDIGILYTTILEMREWIGGDQSTGRICTIPNGAVLSENTNNYTKDHSFVWDEFMLPITYDSNWQKASGLIKEKVEKEVNQYFEDAQNSFSKLEEKYYFSKKRDIGVEVYIKLTDNWIQMSVRYVVDARSRRAVQASIMKEILVAFDTHADINIASATFSLVEQKRDL